MFLLNVILLQFEGMMPLINYYYDRGALPSQVGRASLQTSVCKSTQANESLNGQLFVIPCLSVVSPSPLSSFLGHITKYWGDRISTGLVL